MNIEREESQIKVQDAAEREKNISNARLAAIALMYIYGHGSEELGGIALKPTKSRRTNLANLNEVLSCQEEK